MTPQQWARVLTKGAEAAEQETLDGARQPGHLPGPLTAALHAMASEADLIGREIR